MSALAAGAEAEALCADAHDAQKSARGAAVAARRREGGDSFEGSCGTILCTRSILGLVDKNIVHSPIVLPVSQHTRDAMPMPLCRHLTRPASL